MTKMKTCSVCGLEKPHNEFHVKRSNKDGLNVRCKTCQSAYFKKYYSIPKNKQKYNQYTKKRYASAIDGYHYVYYIPEHHYVGVTQNMEWRMRYHKTVMNRIVNDVETIYRCTCRKEAERVEAKLHSMGYDGENEGRFK